MDSLTRKNLIIDYLLRYLNGGWYCSFTDRYVKKPKDKIFDKEDIIYVKNITDVKAQIDRIIPLIKFMLVAEIEGKEEKLIYYMGIDTYNWDIYLNLGED